MAARLTVNLGTVGFGLQPDTKPLQDSLRYLKQFGKQVDALSQSTEDGAAKIYAKFASIERSLTSLYGRAAQTTAKMREAGVAAVEIDKVDAAYKRLTYTLTQQATALSRSQIARGTVGMSAILAQGNKLARVADDSNRLAKSFRELKDAAIIAVGPLSGIGARLAVMSALFSSTSAKMALFVAGTAGVLTGLGLLARASVKAVIAQQQYDAMLTASTGNAALAGETYQYISGVALQLGQNVRALVEPYAKFTTAARLSGVSLDQQRLIFEGAVTAGTAFRLSSERMQLVFLALEQMFSKGVVTMQELRRQLGDQLPGSFELAAKAMGVTTGAFNKMVAAGEVLPQDMLPKLAKAWLETFGPSAQQAAQTIQNQMQLLGGSVFELEKRFDEVTGFSNLFRSMVVGTNEAVKALTKQMDDLGAVLGAVAGAGAGLALYSLLVKMPMLIKEIGQGLILLRLQLIALEVSTGVGALLPILGRLVVAVGGATAGYYLMKGSIDTVVNATDSLVEKNQSWLDMQTKLGAMDKQTYEQTRKYSMGRLGILEEELAAQQKIVQQELTLRQKSENAPGQSLWDMLFGGPAFPTTAAGQASDKQFVQMTDRLLTLQKQRETLIAQIKQMDTLPVAKGQNNVPTPSTQWDNWAKGIEKLIRDYQSLGNQIKQADISPAAQEDAKALGMALDEMAKMPKTKQGSLDPIVKALRDAGFEGKNLTEMLTKLYAATDAAKTKLKDILDFPKRAKQIGTDLSKMFDDLAARQRAAVGANAETMTSQQKLAVNISTMTSKLKELKLTQDQINYITKQYTDMWLKTDSMERAARETKKLTDQINALENQIGDKGERAAEKFRDQMALIDKAQEKGVITATQAATDRTKVQDDYYRTILDRTTVFGRSLRDMMSSLESSLAKSWADMVVDGTSTWSDMFKEIEKQIVAFMAKMAVIAPIMKALFGSLYTQNSADVGTGLLEGILTKWLKIPSPTSPSPSTAAAYQQTALAGPGFATGGSFLVGGSGGTDNQLVQFMATPGEKVTVTPPNAKGGLNIQVNVVNQSGTPVDAKQGAVTFDGEKYVMQVVLTALRRNNSTRREVRNLLGAPA